MHAGEVRAAARATHFAWRSALTLSCIGTLGRPIYACAASLPSYSLRRMYSLPWMKYNRRWRRLGWRLAAPTGTYTIWVASTVVTLAIMRSVVSSAGPADTREFLAQWLRCFSQLGRVRWERLAQGGFFFTDGLHRVSLAILIADKAHIAADGTYARRKYAEVMDNPLYRCVVPPRFLCFCATSFMIVCFIVLLLSMDWRYTSRIPAPIFMLLCRLPENPAGGHRLDGLSPWQARAKAFEHH